jgi:hypothetical protein
LDDDRQLDTAVVQRHLLALDEALRVLVGLAAFDSPRSVI